MPAVTTAFTPIAGPARRPGSRRPRWPGDREDPGAGAQGGVVAHELEVLGDQEDEAEQCEEADRHGGAPRRSGGPGTARCRASGGRRRARAAGTRSRSGRHRSRARLGAGPAGLRGLDDGPGQQPEQGDRHDQSRLVERRDARVPGLRDERERPSPMATTATGTIAQKTLCQSKCSSSQPPTTGPAATPTPVTAPQMPRAAARCGAR